MTRDFIDVINLRTLRWGNYPGLPGWGQCYENSPIRGTQEESDVPWHQWFSKCGARLATSASSGNLLKTQLHLTLLHTYWIGNPKNEAQKFTFDTSSRWFWYMLKLENHWYKLSFALPDRTGVRLKCWKAHAIGLPKVICNCFLSAWVLSGYDHSNSLTKKSLMFIAEIKYGLYLNNRFWLESYFLGSAWFYLCALKIQKLIKFLAVTNILFSIRWTVLHQISLCVMDKQRTFQRVFKVAEWISWLSI